MYKNATKSFVNGMESLLSRCELWAKRLFPWSARLTILLLPWQTRWFQEGPTIADLSWEQGRLSLYVSEVFMLLTILLGLILWYGERKKTESLSFVPSKIWLTILGSGLFLLSFLSTSSLRSTTEWWLEVVLLIAFTATIFRRMSLRDFSFWFVLSLIPHALLGVFQTIDQHVIGTSVFGIAAQDPGTRGVAVIEVAGVRWLRAYGGFPHPNIFGGWLVLGIVTSYQALKQYVLTKKETLLYHTSFILFGVPLVLTYSRSAWLGLGLFICSSGLCLILSKTEPRKRRAGALLGLLALACILTAAVRPALLSVRAQAGTRLEQKSLSERKQGIENGLRILRESPLLGSGLGANTLMLSKLDDAQGLSSSFPITPHIVPLLMLAELGILGSLLVLTILFLTSRTFIWEMVGSKRRWLSVLPHILAVLPIAFLDHYLWSYWSGKVLLVIFLFVILKFFKRDIVETA